MADLGRPTPTDLLITGWALDGAALAHALHTHTGLARCFLAGAYADDLGQPAGPLELVALSGDATTLARHRLGPAAGLPCPVPVDLLVLPLDLVAPWSERLVQPLVEPARVPAPMPLPVAVGFHALHAQRDLSPGAGTLFAAELERAHAEMLPLYLAAVAQHRLTGAGHPTDPPRRLILLLRAILGAWGQGNPYRDALLPLFERTAPRFGVPPQLPSAVRRALSAPADGDGYPELLADLDRLRQADPMLRFLRHRPGTGGAVELAAAGSPAR